MNPTEDAAPLVLAREDRGPVTVLVLDRPAKLNALSNELLAALMRELDSIELDRAVRRGRAFSAGADIAAFQAHVGSGAAEAIAHFMRPGHHMTRRVVESPSRSRSSPR